jgi:hypothetical protein
MPAGNIGDYDALDQFLGYDLELLLHRPIATALNPDDHLDPLQSGRLGVDTMVKTLTSSDPCDVPAFRPRISMGFFFASRSRTIGREDQ